MGRRWVMLMSEEDKLAISCSSSAVHHGDFLQQIFAMCDGPTPEQIETYRVVSWWMEGVAQVLGPFSGRHNRWLIPDAIAMY